MPFAKSSAPDAPSYPRSNPNSFRHQTPLWVFVSFCLLIAASVGGAGRVSAGELPQVVAAGCSELLINGGFEVNDLAWQTFGAESPPAYTTGSVFSGEQAMRLGIVEGANLPIINGVRQSAYLPNSASSLILSFHYRPIYESLPGDDLQYLDIYDANSGLKLYQLFGALNNSATWIFLQYDLTPLKGKTIRVEVGVRNDGGGGRTAMIIDDLSLLSCDAGPVPTATPTGLSPLPTPTPTNPFLTLTPTASVSPIPVVSATPTPIVSTPAPPTPAPPTPVPTGCVNILENGGFEQPLGSSTGWLPGYIDPVGAELSSEHAEGARSLRLGNPPGPGTQDVVSYSSIRQLVEIPATAATASLSWKHQSRSQEGPSDSPVPPQDRQELILLEPNLDTKAVVRRWREEVPSWQDETEDLTKYLGHTFYIYFNAVNDANSTRTWMFLDDVRLFVCFTAEAATATATNTPIPPVVEAPTPIVTGVVIVVDTPTATGVAAAAMLMDTPTPETAISQSGLPTQEASVMLAEPRTTAPTPTASTSPLWASLLSALSRYRVLIFGGLFVLILIAIFALRR